jgi:hypothetical protein
MPATHRSFLAAVSFVWLLSMPDGASAVTGKYNPNEYLTKGRVQTAHELFARTLRSRKSPISQTDTLRVVSSAIVSALAKRCDLPWNPNLYRPMMAHYRHVVGLGEKEMRALGIVYGFMQASVLHELRDERCPPDIRDSLWRKMPK